MDSERILLLLKEVCEKKIIEETNLNNILVFETNPGDCKAVFRSFHSVNIDT